MVPQPHLPSLLLAAWPADARVACASPQVQGGLTTTWSGLAARRRLPKASVPSTPTFNGENVPTGTGMMHRELRGDLGGGADLSEATCLDHGHDPSERLDAAVRLASGGTRAQDVGRQRPPNKNTKRAITKPLVLSTAPGDPFPHTATRGGGQHADFS